MCGPNIKDFSAWINLMPGGPSALIVVGKVETNNGGKVPQLSEAVPQGINGKILILNLGIVDTGPGTTDINYRDVRYTRPASSGSYTHVEIHWGGTAIATLEVSEVH